MKIDTDDLVKCLGWCGKSFKSPDRINCRFCAKCRLIKDSHERGLSRYEKTAAPIRWNGDTIPMEFIQ